MKGCRTSLTIGVIWRSEAIGEVMGGDGRGWEAAQRRRCLHFSSQPDGDIFSRPHEILAVSEKSWLLTRTRRRGSNKHRKLTEDYYDLSSNQLNLSMYPLKSHNSASTWMPFQDVTPGRCTVRSAQIMKMKA